MEEASSNQESSNREWFESVGYEIEVIETGECRAFHKVGETFKIHDFTTPEGICIEAFHDIYPLLFAGRVNADFRLLGSSESDIKIHSCPSKVVKFKITRFYQCNNCGKRAKKEDLKFAKKEFSGKLFDFLVCNDCFDLLEQ
ncbi:MAG: TIGR04076 family protein [Candidatus Heimdallarchaeaceae archaeon]